MNSALQSTMYYLIVKKVINNIKALRKLWQKILIGFQNE